MIARRSGMWPLNGNYKLIVDVTSRPLVQDIMHHHKKNASHLPGPEPVNRFLVSMENKWQTNQAEEKKT